MNLALNPELIRSARESNRRMRAVCEIQTRKTLFPPTPPRMGPGAVPPPSAVAADLLRALRRGPMTVAQIAAATGFDVKKVKNSAEGQQRRKCIERVGTIPGQPPQATYALTDKGRARLQHLEASA